MGVRPTWDKASNRVTGFEILPASILDRPRIDVTLRISGFFRDAFPQQMALFDSAARAVAKLDENIKTNPLAHKVKDEIIRLTSDGMDQAEAARIAGHRLFGSNPAHMVPVCKPSLTKKVGRQMRISPMPMWRGADMPMAVVRRGKRHTSS